MSAINLRKIISALVLMIGTTCANATLVSVTANFTKFTVDGGYSPLTVNGISTSNSTIDISGSYVNFDDGYNSNTFSFIGNQSDVSGTGIANQFKLGTITYKNGIFYPLSFIDFTLTTHSSEAAFDLHTFDGRIRLDVNGNSIGDPEGSADYFVIQDSSGGTLTSLGSVRVYDYDICPVGDLSAPNCNLGSVDIIGHINSLHLDGFSNPTGGAFVNGSVISTLNTVPSPPTFYLVWFGLLGIFGMRKNKLA